MRRSIATIGVVASIMAVTACSSGPATTTTAAAPATSAPAATTTAPTTDYSGASLTVWVDETRKSAVETAAKAFQTATNAKVNLVLKNFEDIQQDFTTQVPLGKGPDITIGAHDWLGNLIHRAR